MDKHIGPKVNVKNFSLEELQEASEAGTGFCVNCGASRDCCEPDAREYKCEECGKNACYGAEELMLMGFGA